MVAIKSSKALQTENLNSNPSEKKLKKKKTINVIRKTKLEVKINEITKKSKLSAAEVPKKKAKLSEDEIPKKAKKKFVMPSKAVTEDVVVSCLQALEKLTDHHNKKNSIFGDETPIFAEIRCIKIQNGRGNIRFILPHSTISTSGEICLITPDLKKGKKLDHEPTAEHWEDILRKANVSVIKTVLPMRQLRVEYDQYELKRRLLTQHDFIMVDTRVLSHVSHVLGKMFFKKHNMLIPVKINEKHNIKKDIDIGLRTAMLRLNEGQTSIILVGHTGMPEKDVKENVLSLVQQMRDKYPGGEINIRSISLKLPLSVSLPVYLTLRPSNTVGAAKLVHNKPKGFVDCEGELSTLNNGIVRVAPDGTVRVRRHEENTRHVIMKDIEENGVEENDNSDE